MEERTTLNFKKVKESDKKDIEKQQIELKTMRSSTK